MTTHECGCGSGQPRRPLRDAAGTFLCYVCDACEATKRHGYNQNIFDTASAYSRTGNEDDIDPDYRD